MTEPNDEMLTSENECFTTKEEIIIDIERPASIDLFNGTETFCKKFDYKQTKDR